MIWGAMALEARYQLGLLRLPGMRAA
jgi:hypothetical protein